VLRGRKSQWDYVRWAKAVARASLHNPNLTPWLIDDCDGNLGFFGLFFRRWRF